MKYVDEFRQHDLAKTLSAAIHEEAQPGRDYNFMEFCGGHTHAIFRYGVQDLVPGNVSFIHGPGCPVCVLPIPRIDNAIELATRHDVILCTYGDMMRVPASGKRSLIKARADGADIRMIYSTLDALRIAEQHPDRKVVLFAIGFETTTPPTAIALREADRLKLKNFHVFCNHVLTPAAMHHLMNSADEDEGEAAESGVSIDGFLGPSHVSSIIGSRPYRFVASEYDKPIVITGFEPLDVLQSTLMLIRQINQGRCEVENQYNRVVTLDGNIKAQQLVAEYFELRDSFEWRGLGSVPHSALKIRPEYAHLDAEQHYELTESRGRDVRGCECPAILRGVKKPLDCRLFGTVCTPENPQGACMVSSEGSCAAWWSYGRFRQNDTAPAGKAAKKAAKSKTGSKAPETVA